MAIHWLAIERIAKHWIPATLFSGIPILLAIEKSFSFIRKKTGFNVSYSILDPLHVVTAKDFSSWNWSVRRLVKRLLRLDEIIFSQENLLVRKPVSTQEEGTVSQWTDYYKDARNCDTWLVLTKGEKRIVGWLLFVALKDEAFDRLKRGNFDDIEVADRNIMYFDAKKPGRYKVFFDGVAVERGANPKQGGFLLMKKFLEIWEKYEDLGINFYEVCTVAYTEDGQNLCERFGMTHVSNHRLGFVYHIEGPDLLARCKKKLVAGKPKKKAVIESKL